MVVFLSGIYRATELLQVLNLKAGGSAVSFSSVGNSNQFSNFSVSAGTITSSSTVNTSSSITYSASSSSLSGNLTSEAITLGGAFNTSGAITLSAPVTINSSGASFFGQFSSLEVQLMAPDLLPLTKGPLFLTVLWVVLRIFQVLL